MKLFALFGLLLAAGVISADPLPGDRWHAVTLSATDGAPVKWSPGHLSVISFYAFWCDTWRVQEPWLEEAKSNLRGLPVEFLTVSTDGRWKEVQGGKRHLPLLLDSGGSWSRQLGIDHVPTTVILDASGTVCWARSGTVRPGDIAHAVRAVAAPEHGPRPIYLTFSGLLTSPLADDLLDELRRLIATVTFTYFASELSHHQGLAQRALASGHELLCMGWKPGDTAPNWAKCEQAFRETVGSATFNRKGSAQLVTYDPMDATRPGSRELVRRILFAASAREKIQLHAEVSDTLAALSELVPRLRERGFSLDTLPK